MNDLEKFFEANTSGPRMYKWRHYFDIYERHLSKFRGKPVVVVEFGVMYGGSLRMWSNYFGNDASIFGIDIDPRCSKITGDNIVVFQCDQDNIEQLKHIAGLLPQIDVLIDDGGHFMQQQINTFECLFDSVNIDGGVYICEDMHTSYWEDWYGGYKRPGTMVEYSKGFIDFINAGHHDELGGDLTRTINSLHFYDSMLVIEKANRQPPEEVRNGVKLW